MIALRDLLHVLSVAFWLTLPVASPSLTWAQTAKNSRDVATPRKEPDVGYHPTRQDVVERILQELKVGARDTVCDLGCGDGRIPITAARKFGAHGIGYEIDAELVRRARSDATKAGVADRVEIRETDLFAADLKGVTVVTLFLLPELHKRLIPTLNRLPAGTRVATHEFDIPGIQPDRHLSYVSREDDSEHLLYFYTIPLRPQSARE